MKKYEIAKFCWVCNKCGNGAGNKHPSVILWKNNGHKCIFCGKGKMKKTAIDQAFVNV